MNDIHSLNKRFQVLETTYSRYMQKTDYQKYKDGKKWQKEGLKDLSNVGVNEALDRTVKNASKIKDVSIGTGKLIYGTAKKEFAKNKPSPIRNLTIAQFEEKKKEYAKKHGLPKKFIVFDKKKGQFRKDKRLKHGKYAKGIDVKLWKIKQKIRK